MYYDELTKDELFTAGPVSKDYYVKQAEGSDSIYMRTPLFRMFTLDLATKVKEVLRVPNSRFQDSDDYYQVLFLASSGTGAMEMAVSSVQPKKALVVGEGSFSDRWCQLLGNYRCTYDRLQRKDYDIVDISVLLDAAKVLGDPYDVVYFTLFETSECYLDKVASNADQIKRLKDEYGIRTVLDAISGAVVNNVDISNHDIIVTCSQKGFGVSPGLAMFLIKSSMYKLYLDNKEHNKDFFEPYYFNLYNHMTNSKRGSTPFTPPTSLMYGLMVSCQLILHDLDNFQEECDSITRYLFDKLKSNNLITYDTYSGNCVLKVDKLGVQDANEVVKELLIKDIAVAPTDEKSFRIGVYNQKPHVVDRLIRLLLESINIVKEREDRNKEIVDES